MGNRRNKKKKKDMKVGIDPQKERLYEIIRDDGGLWDYLFRPEHTRYMKKETAWLVVDDVEKEACVVQWWEYSETFDIEEGFDYNEVVEKYGDVLR